MVTLSELAQALVSTNGKNHKRKKTKIITTRITNITEHRAPETFLSVDLIIKNNTLYVPSNGQSPNKILFDIDPIYSSPLVLGEIVKNIEKFLNQPVRELSDEETLKLLKAKSKKNIPLLRATDSSTLKDLDKTAIYYSIETRNNGSEWVVFLNNPKEKYFTHELSVTFPIETPLEKLVQVVLTDAKKYPHVFRGK